MHLALKGAILDGIESQIESLEQELEELIKEGEANVNNTRT